MGSTAKSGGIIAQVRLIHLSLQALAMRSWVASTKTRQMAGVRHRAESSNQEQARMELGPALFPSQSMEKSILLETLLTKKKEKLSKCKFLQTFLPIFYTQVEFRLDETLAICLQHISATILGRQLRHCMGKDGRLWHTQTHDRSLQTDLNCVWQKLLELLNKALIKCPMAYGC